MRRVAVRALTEVVVKNSKALTITEIAGRSLALRRPELTWAVALTDAVGDNTIIPLPPGFSGGQFISDEAITTIMRALVTPKMRAQLTAGHRQALDRLADDVARTADPLDPELLVRRVATLLAIDGLPKEVVLDTIADAVERGGSGPYHIAWEETHDALLDLKDIGARAGETVRPVLGCEEFDRMAQFVQDCSPAPITAASERKFFVDEKPVSTSTINAGVHSVLSRCEIWDFQRNKRVAPNNRMVAEVRCALARLYHRSEAGAIRGSAASPVVVFAEERLVLDPTAWTASDEIWAARVAHCGDAASGSRNAFFQELARWGGERIRRTKPRPANLPGYEGIRVRA